MTSGQNQSQWKESKKAKHTRPRRIRLRRIHAKRKRLLHRQIPCLRYRRNTAIGRINDQRVRVREQRHRRGRLVCARVPKYFARLGDALVQSERVGCRVCGARREDVDGRGRRGQRSVVPSEGDPVADLVVLRARDDGGCDHGDATGGQAWVVFRGCGGLIAVA